MRDDFSIGFVLPEMASFGSLGGVGWAFQAGFGLVSARAGEGLGLVDCWLTNHEHSNFGESIRV